MPFPGRVAVVTGGGSGIGRATALAFARAGASVVVADQDPGTMDETVSTTCSAASNIHGIALPVDGGSRAQ